MRRLAADLTDRFGRGFGRSNLYQVRSFYLAYQHVVQAPSGQLPAPELGTIVQTAPGLSGPDARRAADSVLPPPLVTLRPPTGNVRIAAPPGMSLYTTGVFAISKLDWIKQ